MMLSHPPEPLALVGIGCRLPGGVRDPESFWKLMVDRKSGITEVPSDRWDAERYYHPDSLATERMLTRWGGFVDQLKEFDAAFWGLSPREAMRMDPQQRWLLESTWEALEDAGIPPSNLRGTKTGVFVGISANDYHSLQLSDKHHIDVHTNSGGTLSIASNRISYLLDLKGPSLSVDTACSSALVAVSLACQAIWSGECEAAIAGGANALITPNSSIGFSKAGMLSPSGQCYAFDERANGYVRGEGAGVVYLKPLSKAQRDGNPIYAVVRSAVVNQDGHTSSMTVPGVESQTALLRQAYREAGIPPHHVDYIEAHGTGTPVGDPIESEALGQVLGVGRTDGQKCLMGSVKTNIGHLESGSGIAGMIKAALVLNHRMIPPNRNFQKANPRIPFDALGLEVVRELRPLPSHAKRLPVVSINSFGFGGTNAHVVLEAAPTSESRTATKPAAPAATRPNVLTISAFDKTALTDSARAYENLLTDSALPLADICGSAGTQRDHHSERLVVMADSAEQMRERLNLWTQGTDSVSGVIVGQAREMPRELVFVFTGQGSQWWAMGQQLLAREPFFVRTIEQFDALFQSLSGWSIINEMVKPEATSRIDETRFAQPAICALQIGLTELWKSWGIKPTRVVGHSVGEVAAAYCSGALSLEDTVQVIYHRSRLQDTTAGHGRMLAAGITAREAREIIGDQSDRVHITAMNSPGLVTLGGDTAPLEEIGTRLERDGRFMRWLKVNYAFHTHQMDRIRDELLQSLSKIQPRPSRLPFLSTVTGGLFPGEQLTAQYWWNNVRRPVLFEPAITKAIQFGATAFLEVGAHPSMQSSLNECLTAQGAEGLVLHSLARKADETQSLLTNLAQLHFSSLPVDWAAVNQSSGRPVKLPKYPWHYETHWLDRSDATSRLQPVLHRFLNKRIVAARPTWQFDVDLRVFDYLRDHQIWDGVVFPAAGYAEIGLGIAAELFPEDPYSVEELELVKAFFVSPDAVPLVQVTFDPNDRSFQIFSRTNDQQEWELHATGRLVLIAAEPTSGVAADLDQLRTSLSEELNHERFYEELGLLGYQFGPIFSQIEKVFSTPGQSLARIVIPNSIAESTGYRFHPAVLDACFQATHGTREVVTQSGVPDYFFLPESIRRIQLYRETIPTELWVHAKLCCRDNHGILCDVFVYDGVGQKIADILGFRAAQVERKRSSDDSSSGMYQCQWEEQALPDGTREVGSEHDVCLLFSDDTGVAAALRTQLAAGARTIMSLRPGKVFQQISDTHFVIPPDSLEGLRRVLDLVVTGERRLTTIVHCWCLDHADSCQVDMHSLAAAQITGVLSALQLAQVLRDTEQGEARVYFVTRGTHVAQSDDSMAGLASSPVVGFLRVANNELPQFRWTQVDLDKPHDAAQVSALVHEITRASEEREVALRSGRRLVHRLRPIRSDELALRSRNAIQPDGSVVPWRLQTNKPGILTSLSLNETFRRDPGDDEIEVRVMAGGINFRDLMKAMGMYPGNPVDLLWFGDDFSGVVERVGKNVKGVTPGDRVAGLAPYCFRSYVTVHHRMVFRLPESISFQDAATLPTVFLTAHYSINELAHLQPGESILIHAGTGGVGLAAIQVAQRLGLEIFATAGSVEKRRLLKELGVPHVLNSRNLEFADQIMEITQGRGVDAVLNSLARDFIPKSLSVLAPFGRFLEIGKIDVYGNTRVRLNALKDNISYFVIDLAQHLSAKPGYVASMFDELARRFAAGDYQPLPNTVFPITEVVSAFRYMAQGKHVGKNVLSFTASEIPVAPCNEPGKLLKPDATYLITGGAGGFGWEIAKWMVSEGARHLALMSRSGPREEIADELAQLRAAGVTVMDLRADVTDPVDVQRAIEKVSGELPPLRGIVHAAMVLDDTFIHELDNARFMSVVNPKLMGGWNLHAATLGLSLDHFISFSSVSGLIGTTKQSNYSAANCFLDGLAAYRQSLGLPALTVNWGAIGGSGYLERNLKAKEYLDKVGFRVLLVSDAVKALRDLMQRQTQQVCVAKADWDQLARFSPALKSCPIYSPLFQEKVGRRSGGSVVVRVRTAVPDDQVGIIEEFLAEQVARVFGIDATQVDRETPLTQLGLDSLMAVDLMNRLESELNLSIPMGSVLAGPNVRQLATTLLGLVLSQGTLSDSTDDVGPGAIGSATELTHVVRQNRYALTGLQDSILQTAGERGIANVSCMARIRPGLDPERLRLALIVISRRHPLLCARIDRTVIPAQIVLQRSKPLELSLYEDMPADSRSVHEGIATDRDRSFDLMTGPLARCSLWTSGQKGDSLLISVHPLAADEWSVTLLLKELLELVQSSDSLEESAESEFSFQDYASWQREVLAPNATKRLADHWVEQIDHSSAGLNWPKHARSNCIEAGREGVLNFTVCHDLSLSLMSLAAEQGVATTDLLLTAYQITLHHYCQQWDLLVGYEFDGRELAQTFEIVGPLANRLPLRSRIEAGSTYQSAVQASALRLKAARENQRLPLSNLLAHVDWPSRVGSQTPWSASFASMQFPGIDESGLAILQLQGSSTSLLVGDLCVESIPVTTAGANSLPLPHRAGSDLLLRVGDGRGTLFGEWRFDDSKLTLSTVNQIYALFLDTLAKMVSSPHAEIDFQFQASPADSADKLARTACESPSLIRRIGSRIPDTMAQDIILDPLIAPVEPQPSGSLNRTDKILVTGATGFLGAYLLNELLQRTTAEVVCLVRAADEVSATRRVLKNLSRYQLAPPNAAERIRVVAGDFSQPRLGLTPEAYDRLAAEIDVIYHNGANVNLVLPYESLRSANVGGVREILQLAAAVRTKPVHLVSTFTVHTTAENRGCLAEEAATLPPVEKLLYGYSQTKWVGETLAEKARKRGIPVTIYRPGHITGDSVTGASNTGDLLHTIVLICLKLGMAPLRDVEFDVTPVDYVAKALVELSLQPDSRGRNFHLTNPAPMRTSDLLDWMQQSELAIRVVPYEEWRIKLLELGQQMGSDEMRILTDVLGARAFANDNATAVHPRFDTSMTRSLLATSKIACPPARTQLFDVYLSYLRRMKLIEEASHSCDETTTRVAT